MFQQVRADTKSMTVKTVTTETVLLENIVL